MLSQMESWQESLRETADALCKGIGDVCADEARGGAACALANAAADALRLQERAVVALLADLREERAWRDAAERRIERLERLLGERCRSGAWAAGRTAEGGGRRGVWVRGDVPGARRYESSSEVLSGAEEEGFAGGGENVGVDDLGSDKDKCDGALADGRTAPLIGRRGEREEGDISPDSPSKRARLIEEVTPAKPRKSPPPLPTLRDVKNDLAKRRDETRARRRYKPLPCDRCRLRKRAVMLRKSGYVDEKVFERWAGKPGNCLEYMHLDEEVPPGQPRSPLSFEESETQSPG